MMSCVIDEGEGIDVETVDITGVFIQAGMDNILHMNLEVHMDNLIVRSDVKSYRKYIQPQNGKEVLGFILQKMLYIKSNLRHFYEVNYKNTRRNGCLR